MADKSSDLFGSITISSDQKAATPSEKQIAPKKKQQKAPKVQKRKSSGGTFKFIFLILAGIGLYAGAGFILIPHLAKTSLPKYLGEKLHVNLSISDARFNPFNFQLNLNGLSVETNEDGEPQTRFLLIAEALIPPLVPVACIATRELRDSDFPAALGALFVIRAFLPSWAFGASTIRSLKESRKARTPVF